jgi:hypothetical protein
VAVGRLKEPDADDGVEAEGAGEGDSVIFVRLASVAG